MRTWPSHSFARRVYLPGRPAKATNSACTAAAYSSCISPWNFPLAIFLGQITAALAAGNSVIAKPAAQTPLIGAFVVELAHAAGVPAGRIGLSAR